MWNAFVELISIDVFLALAEAASGTQLESWSPLAYQYGPFFFSLLFLCVLLWQLASKMAKASGADKGLWRRLIYCTFTFGVLLVGFSVFWWATHQVSMYVFRGKIQDLASYEQLGGSDFFFRSEWKTLTGDVQDLRRDVRFLVLQDKPFREGQSFALDFAKGPSSSRNKFQIVFDPRNSEATYEVVWNDKEQRNELRKSTAAGSTLVRSALPSGLLFVQTVQPPTALARPYAVLADPEVLSLLGLLQDERNDVGSKIDAMDRILAAHPTRIREIMGMRTEREPAVLTFYDLSRHSDRELSAKARRVLDLGAATDMLATNLTVQNPQQRAQAVALLARIPRDDAAAIIKQVKSNNPAQARSLESNMARQAAIDVKPTGSPQGDRYYVKASWNPGDERTVRCLTELFNRELMSNRGLEEEAKLMQGRSTRFAYWYSKDWALRMAGLIRGCGAKAEFVHP